MIVVDTSTILYSAMHTHGHMEYNGQGTGIVYGFFSQMMSWYKKFRDPSFIWAWDSSKSERMRIFPEYKYVRRNREKDADELELDAICFPQLHLLRKEIFPKIGVENSFRQVGYEADDVLANIVYGNVFKVKPIMVTGDEDMYQCLDACSIWLPGKKILMTKKLFEQEYEIKPKQWILVKQIAGCKSDEVPGVAGVGNPTACEYIKGTLPKHFKKFEKIEAATELIKFNHQLVALPMDGTRDCTLKTQFLCIDTIYDYFEEFGMERFLKNFRDWEDFIEDANETILDEIEEIPF